jgi:WD40 repeat protein
VVWFTSFDLVRPFQLDCLITFKLVTLEYGFKHHYHWPVMNILCISVAVAKFRGHKNATFYVKTSLSPDDRFLLGGSSDYNAYIWRVDHVTESEGGCAPVLALEGHSNEVTGVAWCPTDMCRLVTLSDDNTVWIWRLNQCRSHDLVVNNELGDVVGRTKRLCTSKGRVSSSGFNCSFRL